MCDTVVAPPGSTAGHIMLFGKNSDRQRNEAQNVDYFAAADHPPGAQVSCTYIAIKQASHTYAVLLCRPFWIWGAEMGANEHGVVIGNEGLTARTPAPQANALTGMDLLRLALERAATAAEAVNVITTLLERHGQGGNCGHLIPSYYNNGFVIADPAEAFVLETVEREWFVERVSGVRALSNKYSIAEWLADPQTAHVGSAGARRARATSLMRESEGRLGVAHILGILRDHDVTGQAGAEWDCTAPHKYSLCIHAGAGDRIAQTTGAMVSEIRSRDSVHWVTGTAAPCISIFKPLLMGELPSLRGPPARDRFDARTLWWRHEQLHRAALTRDFATFLADIAPERDQLEADFHARMVAVLNGGNIAERSHTIASCWNDADEMERSWLARVGASAAHDSREYLVAWAELNRAAGLVTT